MKRYLTIVLLLLIAVFTQNATIEGQEAFFQPALQPSDIESNLGIDWYGVYLQGRKIGWCRNALTRAGDNIADSLVLRAKIVALGTKSEIGFDQVRYFESRPPYRLVFAALQQFDGFAITTVNVQRTGQGWVYTTDASGQRRDRAVADPGFSLADLLSADVWLRASPKPGSHIFQKDLDVQEWSQEAYKHRFLGAKNSLVSGVQVKYFEVETENRKNGIRALSRFDSAGKPLSANLGMLDFELRRETEKQAKNTQYSQDLFVLGMAKIDRPIGDCTRLAGLVLAAYGKESEVFVSGPQQTVSAFAYPGGQGRLIKLGKAHDPALKATAKEITDNLAASDIYDIANPRIKALAQQVAQGATTDREKLRRIVAFTHQYIKPNLAGGSLRIHDLLEQKKGHCEHYALLMVNLCRAAGLPARDVSGLLYMGDDQRAFGGHAWNEVVVDGVWVSVDASLNQVEADPGHIRLAAAADSRAEAAIMGALGKLSFRLVELQPSGR